MTRPHRGWDESNQQLGLICDALCRRVMVLELLLEIDEDNYRNRVRYRTQKREAVLLICF